MNYVILNYADDGSLTHSAIIFGKNNLKLVDTKQIFNLYKFTDGDNEFYFPIKKSNERLKLEQSQIIFTEYPFLNNCKKIVSLPSLKDENLISFYKDETLLAICFQGDPVSIEYDNPVKMLSCVKPSEKIKNDFFFDLKLCLPFFYYKHQLSLVDFNKIENYKINKPEDKIFFYSRRVDEFNSELRDRFYFTNLIYTNVDEKFLDKFNAVHKNLELSRIHYGLYHLGNFFDYNNCMFNLIFESQHVDFQNDYQTWISEKSLFALLFSNPFFLLANKYILASLKELNIQLLNDEFIGNDIEQKFNNFCSIFKENSFEYRKNLFTKMNEKQIENRKKMLEYIHSPKKEVIEFLIS